MSSTIATLTFAMVVVCLFVLDRERPTQTSNALWLPVIWLSLLGSRMVSQWLDIGAPALSAEQALDGNPLDRNILAVLILAALLVLLRRRAQVGVILRSNAPILLFFLYCVVSISWSDFPGVAFKRWSKALGDLFMVMVVVTEEDPAAALKRLLTRVGYLLVPASVLMIKYYPALAQNYSGAEGRVKYTGIARDKNMLGVVCLITGLGCAMRFASALRGDASARKLGPLLAQTVFAVMLVWLFWKANSATALGCFLLGSGLIFMLRLPGLGRNRALLHVAVLVVLSLAAAALFVNAGAVLVETMGRDATLTGRTGLWNQLLTTNSSPWLGAGFESYWLGARLERLWSIYWWHPNEAHNGYLEVFLNLGAVGVMFLALVIIAGYRNAVIRFRAESELDILKVAFFVVGLAYSLTEAGFRLLSPVWIVFMLGALSLPTQSARAESSVVLPPVSRPLGARWNPSFVVRRNRQSSPGLARRS